MLGGDGDKGGLVGTYRSREFGGVAHPHFAGADVFFGGDQRASSDEGAGFDWRRQMAYSENPADEECTSGRGIFLLKSYNCHPAYNEKGNVLSLKIELA